MGVTVQRKCRGIVSGILLDRFYVVPGPEGIHHIGVPEIVETVPFQSGLLENLLERFPDRWLGQVAPIRVCEDQVGEATIVPGRAHSLPLQILRLLITVKAVRTDAALSFPLDSTEHQMY